MSSDEETTLVQSPPSSQQPPLEKHEGKTPRRPLKRPTEPLQVKPHHEKDKDVTKLQQPFIQYAAPTLMSMEDDGFLSCLRFRVFDESYTATLDKPSGSRVRLLPYTKTRVQLVWNEDALYQRWDVQINSEEFGDNTYMSQLGFMCTIALCSSEERLPDHLVYLKFNWNGDVVEGTSTANGDNRTHHISVVAGGELNVRSGSLSDGRLDYVERPLLVKIPAVDLGVKQLNVDQHVLMGLYRYIQTSQQQMVVQQAWGQDRECTRIVMASSTPQGSLVLKKN